MLLWLVRLPMLFILLTNLVGNTYAQEPAHAKADSVLGSKGFVAKMQEFARKSAISSAADLEADRAGQVQEATLVEIEKKLQKVKLYLRTALDTVSAKRELLLIAQHAGLAGAGVFTHKGAAQTYRNLVSAEKVLKVLSARCKLQKDALDKHKRQLSGFKLQMDSLASTKELFNFPQDSVKLSKYIQALFVLAEEVAPIDSIIDHSIVQVQALQNQANLQTYNLESSLDEIELYQHEMADHLFKKEYNLIWENAEPNSSLRQIIAYSFQKNKLLLGFFASTNIGMLFCTLLLFLICYAFILSLRNTYFQQFEEKEINEDQLILRYPLLSAIFIISNLSQFLFNSPPFIFSLFIWLMSAVSLTLLMYGYIAKFWMRAWLGMLLLFLLAALDNLILQASTTERWCMLVLSLGGVVLGLFIFKNGSRSDLREKFIVYAIGLMVVLEAFSLLFNIFGNYNLAKALLVAGYVNVIIAILFLWTVRLIDQGLKLAFNLYTKQDKSLFFMNFDRVGQKTPMLLYGLLVLGWLILFGRNFPAYAFIVEPVRNFFFNQRAIGSYTFSISSLILFFFVVSTSVVVSKVVSFFAVDKRVLSVQDGARRGIGSWILLVRITIILLGLFLAFASVGIPIDKIAIVLGALGVGIGFGLQSLVNNLVSGLVIAFEKPMNLDDEVEVGGKSGTVKSIGFRSSVIATFDGAEIVMPNGDLLNSHLVNWSSGSIKRRSSIVVNIAHGADLQLIRTNIMKILSEDDRVMKRPEPTVFFQDINAEALELHVFYWSKQPKVLIALKSDLIIAINQLFLENKLSFPYPKQEVFIHHLGQEKDEN